MVTAMKFSLLSGALALAAMFTPTAQAKDGGCGCSCCEKCECSPDKCNCKDGKCACKDCCKDDKCAAPKTEHKKCDMPMKGGCCK